MSGISWRSRVLALAAVGAIGFTACGDDDTPTTATSDGAASEATTTASFTVPAVLIVNSTTTQPSMPRWRACIG